MARVHRLAIALLATYNPRWRASPSPYGEIDWIATSLRRATTLERDYVVRTSQTGLDEDERDVLLGWIGWLRALHVRYFPGLGLEAPPLPEWVHASGPSPAPPERLRRWARIARRSRWPLLRNIVAESLRCVVEPEVLDQLPLPSTHEDLFELACLVRMLKVLSPPEALIRWLDPAFHNTLRTADLTVRYQHALNTELTLRAGLYPPETAVAMRDHGIAPPSRTDLLIELERPRRGFHGLLVECKSGKQDPASSLYQLLVYRSALRKKLPGRLLIWGIVEKPWAPVLPSVEGTSDCWIFSSADHIAAVLEQLGLSSSAGRQP